MDSFRLTLLPKGIFCYTVSESEGFHEQDYDH